MKYRVTTPVPGFSGEVAGVHFRNGVAEVEAPAPLPRLRNGETFTADEQVERDAVVQDPGYRAMAYFRAQGYLVEVLDADGEEDQDGEEDGDGDDQPALPNRSASKSDWVAYAVHPGGGGMPADEAEAATRDQLAERFLGPKEN